MMMVSLWMPDASYILANESSLRPLKFPISVLGNMSCSFLRGVTQTCSSPFLVRAKSATARVSTHIILCNRRLRQSMVKGVHEALNAAHSVPGLHS